MKKLVRMFALAAMLIVGGQAVAQTRGVMFLGASFPMKDYGKFDGWSDFALTKIEIDEDYAGAGIGFTAGLKWYFNVGVEGLGVMLSIDGIYNGPNPDLKTAYRNNESEIGNLYLNGSFKYNSTPKFINAPAMLGLNYIFRLNPNFGVFVEAGAGGNFRFITEMETIGKLNVLGVESQQKITNTYDKAFSFAYQAGVGIEVAKNLVIGCSFYDLGSAEVKGDVTTKTTTDNVAKTDKSYNTFGTVHPIMVMGRIGFSF